MADLSTAQQKQLRDAFPGLSTVLDDSDAAQQPIIQPEAQAVMAASTPQRSPSDMQPQMASDPTLVQPSQVDDYSLSDDDKNNLAGINVGSNANALQRSLAEAGANKAALLKPYLDSQKQGLKDMEALKQAYGGANNVDITPLMAWYDSQYGTKLAQNYKSPDAQLQDKLKEEGELQKQRQDLTADQLKVAAAGGALSPVAQARLAQAQDNYKQRQDFFDQRIHKSVMSAIDKDPTLKTQFQNLRGLQNAATLVDKTDNPTVQQLDEMQQAVIRSLNLQGTSDSQERLARYYGSLGMDADKAIQYASGQLQGISKDNAFLKQVRDLAHYEAQNGSAQIQDQINGLGDGYGYMYDRRPDLKSALLSKLGSVTKKADLPITKNNYLANPAVNYPPGSDSGAISTPAQGKITVSNGSKTFQIDPSDLASANKDGFSVVK